MVKHIEEIVRTESDTSRNFLLGSIISLMTVSLILVGVILYQSAILSTTQKTIINDVERIKEISDINKNNVIDLTRIVEERLRSR